MFQKHKELKALEKEAEKSTGKKVENGYFVLDMHCGENAEFLSSFYSGERIISGEAADFIENRIGYTDVKNKLQLNIYGESEVDGQVYETALQNYYRNKFLYSRKEIKLNTVISLILTILAVLVFAVTITLDVLKVGSIVLEIVDIVGWVFMWEAVDIFFFQRRKLKFDMLKYAMIYSAKITINTAEAETNE